MPSYLHALEGRLRVRLPALRKDRRAAVRLRQEMQNLPGVITAEANPLTGSMLIEYDEAQTSTETLLAALDIASPAEAENRAAPAQSNAPSSPDVSDIVLEKALEWAAQRLLLAVLT
jgi:hypothetical protein